MIKKAFYYGNGYIYKREKRTKIVTNFSSWRIDSRITLKKWTPLLQ